MAVLNPKKLLPQSKDGVLAKVPTRPTFTPKYALVPVRKLKPESEPESKPSEKKVTLLNQVIEIKKKTISIDKIVDRNTKLYQKSEERKKKLLERQKREKREEKLEEKKPDNKKEEKGISVPGLGFLDGVKKFIVFTALGGLLGLTQKYIPKILEALKVAGPIFEFIESTVKMLVGGFTTFIEKAYALNDAIRTEIENFGGDEALKKFDSFTDAFKKYANLAIALFAAGVPSSIPLGPKGKLPGGKVPGGAPGGKGGGKLGSSSKPKSLSKFQLEQLRKKAPAVKGPGIGPKSGAPKGGIFKRGIPRSLTRAQIKLIGRQNQLMLSRAANSLGRGASNLGGRLTLGGKLPIIGPIIMGYDAYMADADGDGLPDKKLDKALFVAGGSALGGLLAAGIPVVGPILGSLAGGYVGDLMYEMILGKGFAAAGTRFKNDVVNVLKGSLAFGKHLTDSVGRFFSYLPKMKIAGFETAIPSPEIFTGSFDLMGALKAALFPGTFTFPEGGVTEEIIGRKIRGRSGAKRAKEAKQEIITSSKGVFEVIASGEGGYNSVNRGTAGDTPGGAQSIFGKNLTDMTVGEIINAQQAKKVFAVGKYQIIDTTMLDFVNNSSVDRDDLFNASTQEKFTDYVINVKRPAVGKYLRGETNDPTEAGQALAREFASVGLQYAENGMPRGSSRYADRGGNRASITPEEIIAALEKDRKAYSKGGKTKSGAHFILVGEKGSEYVLDADTTAGLEDNYPGFLDRINKADYKGSLDVLRNYASYDVSETILVVQEIETVIHASKESKSSPLFA